MCCWTSGRDGRLCCCCGDGGGGGGVWSSSGPRAAKRTAIEGDGSNLGLCSTIADNKVDGKRVPSRLPAIVRLVGEFDGGARRRRGIGRPHLKNRFDEFKELQKSH